VDKEEILAEEGKRGFAKLLAEARTTTKHELSNDYPECRGMSFKEFWNWLPNKLILYDYEEELLDHLKNGKYLWIKKATGLGVTELLIRWIAWNCLCSNDFKDSQVDTSVVLITGPRIELSITIMKRLKDLFTDEFKNKETVCVLNGCRIEAFPSHHLATARGLNPRIVFLDEADFFPIGQQQEARDVSERYIAKTDPHIIMVSTPNLPGGLFETMEFEETSLYNRIQMNYEHGLGKIYTKEQIAKAKESPSFEREYNLKYGYGVGDIFEGIDDIIEKYDLEKKGGRSCVTADPAFGFSKFGIVAGEVLDGIAYVKEANEYARPSPSAMLDRMEVLAIQWEGSCKVDAAHPGFIRDLQDRGIPAIPVNFGLVIPEMESATVQSLRSKMTINASQMVKNKLVKIHPDFTTLISQMRAVRFDAKGGIDKTETSFDVVDAFIMWCWDMKEFDYTSIGITHDGKLIKEKDIKHSKGLIVKTEVFE